MAGDRRLILASTSPYRALLLERLGLPFDAIDPDYSEANLPGVDPAELVVEQARAKAKSLAPQHPAAIIVGSDQVAEIGGETLTKPGSREAAIAQLGRLAGREHRLLTAVSVVCEEKPPIDPVLVVTRLRMRDLTTAEIERYVATERPMDCAGSYKIESLGVSLFEYQRGDDPTAVIGLPLMATCRLLRAFGVTVP